MKIRFIITTVTLMYFASVSFAEVYTVSNIDLEFYPSELTISPGDTINFILGSIHDAVEVSKSEWDIGGNKSNGGFAVDYGGGTIVLTEPGTYYYVCQPHASAGMKGKIFVEDASTLLAHSENTRDDFRVYPNPIVDNITIDFKVSEPSDIDITIYNLKGEAVKTIFSGNIDRGSYQLEYNLNQLVKGDYVIVLQSGNHYKKSQLINMY